MLGLLKPTDPSWVKAAEQNLEGLLSDHAHCEMKAAQSALSLVGRFGGQHPELVEPLLALAAEEVSHVQAVLKRVADHRSTLEGPRSDGYVTALQDAAKTDRARVPLLLDRLLVAALIEARSCERFKLLAEGLESEDLRGFYRDLMASEARHYRLFVRLAEDIFGVEVTRTRFTQLAEREASVAADLPLGATVHG